MAWEDEVQALARQIEAWAPPAWSSEREPTHNGEGPVLTLRREDASVYLEPARWSVEEGSLFVDLWSTLGRRVRLGRGEAGEDGWRVYDPNFLRLRVPWERVSVSQLIEELVAS